jgi:hypothetical protein
MERQNVEALFVISHAPSHIELCSGLYVTSLASILRADFPESPQAYIFEMSAGTA